MSNSIKIVPPEGFEVDIENSTFEEVKFKKKENNYPKKWEEINNYSGYYINNLSIISPSEGDSLNKKYHYHKNNWPTKEYAEAALALSQLLRYRKEWLEVDKKDFQENYLYIIISWANQPNQNQIYTPSTKRNHPLNFPTERMCKEFLESFKDLITTALPLL